MIEIQEIEKGIFTFPVVLPDNPLKWLNCYIIKGDSGSRNLLIDSGFHRKECTRTLFDGIKALNLSPEDSDIFFTHLHSDHTGNGYELFRRGYKIMMSETDYKILTETSQTNMSVRGVRLGIPADLIDTVVSHNPGLNYASQHFEARFIRDGDILSCGGRKLRCLHMPGHTPGLYCLYDEANGVLFSSDHVLFDITPNIVSWTGYSDSLGKYLESLQKVRKYNVRLCLPAHRTDGGKTMQRRVDEITAHHARRLNETFENVCRHPGRSAYEVAQDVKWHIRARNWEEFPTGQKWFAVGETLAHLELLQAESLLTYEINDAGAFIWYKK